MKYTFARTMVIGMAVAGAVAAAPAQTVIESFENAAQWTAAGNDIVTNNATVTSTTVESDTTEGTGSLEFTYNYSGVPYFEVNISKTFDTPRDLSDVVAFDVDIKGNAAASENMVWFLSLKSENGNSIQLLHNVTEPDYEPLPVDNFKRWSFALSELRWGGYYNTDLDQFDLGRVTGLALYLQQKGNVSAAGSAVVTIDNLVAHTTTDRQTVEVLEPFAYADTAAVQTSWPPALGNAGNTATVALGPDLSGTGGSLDITFNASAQHTRMGAIHTLPAARDFSDVAAFIITLEGDQSLPSSYFKFVRMSLRDGIGNEAFWNISSVVNQSQTRVYLSTDFSVDAPNEFWESALQDFPWDPPGTSVPFDISNVTHLIFTWQDSNADGYPYSANLKIDEIQTITSNNLPNVSEIDGSNVSDWELY